MELEPLFLQQFLESLGNVLIEHRGDAREKLDHRHLRAQPRPDRAKLQPDRAAANHDHRLRRLAKRDCVVAAQHRFAVELEERQAAYGATGGDEDALGFKCSPGLSPSDLNLAGIDDATGAAHVLDAVFVHQVIDAPCHLAYDAVLALHHRRDIKRQPLRLDTM